MARTKTDYVTPPSPIKNRRTGYEQQFGDRRAYDGAYILELLAASGCWTDDVQKTLFVLQGLTENGQGHITAEQLAGLLPIFYEQATMEEMEQIRGGGSGRKINGVWTVTPKKPDLKLVETD
jgi:ADP-ribosylglycohydrolase